MKCFAGGEDFGSFAAMVERDFIPPLMDRAVESVMHGRCVAGHEAFDERVSAYPSETPEIACSPVIPRVRAVCPHPNDSSVVKRSVASLIAGSEVRILPDGREPGRSSAAERATPARAAQSRMFPDARNDPW